MTTIKTEARRLVSSGDVQGTDVFNTEGDKLGSIDCVMIDKQKGNVAYAVMSFGGFLGMGEKRHPLPWQSLAYDVGKDAYVVRLSKDQLKSAPHLNPGDYRQLGERKYDESVFAHYKANPYWL